MTTPTSVSSAQAGKAPSFLGHVHYKTYLYRTIAIFPDLASVADAITLLNKEGFDSEQISLLGREQENWREKLDVEWQMLHTAKGAAGGAALGLIPGLVLATGVAITGGVGVLAAGPMISALATLGMGALGGGLLGGAVSNLDSTQRPAHIREEIKDAIGRGQWVVMVHSHDETEAMHAQSLLPSDSRIAREPDGMEA